MVRDLDLFCILVFSCPDGIEFRALSNILPLAYLHIQVVSYEHHLADT
jgi:hypothetical protein